MIASHWRIGISVEFHYGVYKLPYFPVGSMEDVCPVLMHVDDMATVAFCRCVYGLAIDIAASVVAFVYHETTLAVFACEVGESGAKESGSHYQIIVRRVLCHNILGTLIICLISRRIRLWCL